MSDGRWTYPPEMIDALLGFGLAPTAATPPRFVRDSLSDLYLFEIRQLREQLKSGAFPMTDYARRVILLRDRYWPLKFTPEQWEKICAQGAQN